MSNSQGSRFSDRIRQRARETRSWLCVGLDPLVDRLPACFSHSAQGVEQFCSAIVEATSESAVCFKLNFAFFEALGSDGWKVLSRVRGRVPRSIPVIADAKRGDVASSASAYARAIFDELDFDAVTLSPYMGTDSLGPYTTHAGRCLFILAKTSNPGAPEYQDLVVGGEPLYLRVARSVLALVGEAEIGLVAGATYLESVAAIRRLSESALLLIPGAGAQGAHVRDAHRAGANAGGENAIITLSREILYASPGSDFATAAGEAAARCASLTRQSDSV